MNLNLTFCISHKQERTRLRQCREDTASKTGISLPVETNNAKYIVKDIIIFRLATQHTCSALEAEDEPEEPAT